MPVVIRGEDLGLTGDFTIEFGGVVDGTPTWGTPLSVKCYLRAYTRNVSWGVTDVGGRCDTEVKQLPGKKNLQATLELTVPITGAPLVAEAAGGQYIRTSYTRISGATPVVDIGFLSGIDESSPAEGVTTQTLSIAPAA